MCCFKPDSLAYECLYSLRENALAQKTFLLLTHGAAMSSPQIQNATTELLEDAAALAARLGQLTATLQQSSSANVASASQHLALYQEVVQTLQVVTLFGYAIGCSSSSAYKNNMIL